MLLGHVEYRTKSFNNQLNSFKKALTVENLAVKFSIKLKGEQCPKDSNSNSLGVHQDSGVPASERDFSIFSKGEFTFKDASGSGKTSKFITDYEFHFCNIE